MKNQLIRILNVAISYVECCNEYSYPYIEEEYNYIEEEYNYKELLHKIEKENHEDFSKEEIEVLIDACNNAMEELEMNEINFNNEYYEELNNIVDVQNKLKEQL